MSTFSKKAGKTKYEEHGPSETFIADSLNWVGANNIEQVKKGRKMGRFENH